MPGRQPDSRPLQDLKVLVTRPAQQAQSLCQRITALGGVAVSFPVLDIRPPADPAGLQGAPATLDQYDWAIFVSANAVQRALPVILAQRSWPVTVRIAVIGKSSAAALDRFGLSAQACPSEQFDTEGLLALPTMQQVAGQRVVIFRGQGGRETLAERLRERGARVDYVACYRRVKPPIDSQKLNELGKIGVPDIVLVNSADSLNNLCQLLGEQPDLDLFNRQLLVVSERLVSVAGRCGFVKPPLVADNATDDAVVRRLIDWRQACAD